MTADLAAIVAHRRRYPPLWIEMVGWGMPSAWYVNLVRDDGKTHFTTEIHATEAAARREALARTYRLGCVCLGEIGE